MNLGNPRGGSGSALVSPGATLPGVTSWNPSGIPAATIMRSRGFGQFRHSTSVTPRWVPAPPTMGTDPLHPSRRKGTAYDWVTGIVQCRRRRVGKDRLVACTDLARSGCYKVGPVQGQATIPSLLLIIPPSQLFNPWFGTDGYSSII